MIDAAQQGARPRTGVAGYAVAPAIDLFVRVCGGPDSREKHPACGVLTCCAVKNGLEVCSECSDYPCPRFEPRKVGFDSFVTHRMMYSNLDAIRTNGLAGFLDQQRIRMGVLRAFMAGFDDGRSKSFF